MVNDASRRMEYRGYDSAGVALLDGCGGMSVRRRAGRLANLEAALDDTDDGALVGNTGLGHTRWATHGHPTDGNARPHRDAAGKIAVVHDGIIENFTALRDELEAAGAEFASDTDAEVAVHLVAQQYKRGDTAGDFAASVLAVLRRREGHFTLVFANADEPGTIICRPPLHPAGDRRRGRRDVRRLGRGRVRRAHPRRCRARSGPGRGAHRRRPQADADPKRPPTVYIWVGIVTNGQPEAVGLAAIRDASDRSGVSPRRLR
jgi:hypothetical protein